MTERRDIQKLTLAYLSSRWETDRVLSTTEVREVLGLTVEQMKQTKGCLVSKGLAIDYGRGLFGLNQTQPSKSLLCSLLTRKTDELRKDELYCPLKKTFIPENEKYHFCGKMLHVRFFKGEPELFWKPNCDHWSGK